MQDLRIVGVDAEGPAPRLLLSDSSGAEYALPVDQALHSAVAGATSSTAQSQSASPLSPRDIQARLRSGATVEQVVADSGLTRDHVLRYAGPVADERAFFAARARETVVARPSTAEQHRLAFGDAPATLEAMVKVRLRTIGVDLNSLSWDAWRREDGLWAVTCDFDAASSTTHAAGIGQRPPAEWAFDSRARSVQAENEWAESLSSLPAAPSRTVGRRLTAVDEPFNVDEQSDSPAEQSGSGHEDLLEILRARRGQRLGTDETGDDKLATLLTRDEQPPPGPAQEQTTDTLPGLGEELAEEEAEHETEADSLGQTDAWGFSYEESSEDSAEPDEDAQEPAPQSKKRSGSRRPTMPRWDDILFGGKE
ncbi:septation protein SepH [Nesterenkonia muleiensis]|uniref:septation protein SepH n=1 Tax=Nesterenkonia muleiensis TaxID=2282648 RepID=UPI000E75AE9C|nr:septation protein SepH [Nesterenkonia muleiensis]